MNQEYVGVTTSAPESESIKLIYPAARIVLANNDGKLGVYPEGAVDDQGKPKGVPVDSILGFPDIASAIAWLTGK
jgi:hypothetical protein